MNNVTRDWAPDFLRSVEACLLKIRRYPEIFPVAYKNVRQGLVRRFPYSILYILAGANLIVISVFHSARDPEIWQQRV